MVAGEQVVLTAAAFALGSHHGRCHVPDVDPIESPGDECRKTSLEHGQEHSVHARLGKVIRSDYTGGVNDHGVEANRTVEGVIGQR